MQIEPWGSGKFCFKILVSPTSLSVLNDRVPYNSLKIQEFQTFCMQVLCQEAIVHDCMQKVGSNGAMLPPKFKGQLTPNQNINLNNLCNELS